MDTLCGDCKEKEFKYYYSFPHPERWSWYCNSLNVELTEHSGVRRNAMCPAWLEYCRELKLANKQAIKKAQEE